MESVNKADILKNWLLGEGISRDTLAEELGVSKRTVDNWCSGREIPPVKWARILERMNKPAFCYSSVAVVPVRFTLSEWEQVKTKIPQGVDAEEFLRAVLLGGAYRGAEGVTVETDDPIPCDSDLEAAEEVMPGPSEMPVPYIPAARGSSGPMC